MRPPTRPRSAREPIERGLDQVGTLGSGNHFMELGVVDEVYDERAAEAFGLRALGRHTADPLGIARARVPGLRRLPRGHAGAPSGSTASQLPDRQLACAPVESPEGRSYLAAMACAANYAWANRQVMMALAKRAVASVLGGSGAGAWAASGLRRLPQHRQARAPRRRRAERLRSAFTGRARRARFPAGHEDVPSVYRSVGQPVLVPGDMGTQLVRLCRHRRAR